MASSCLRAFMKSIHSNISSVLTCSFLTKTLFVLMSISKRDHNDTMTSYEGHPKSNTLSVVLSSVFEYVRYIYRRLFRYDHSEPNHIRTVANIQMLCLVHLIYICLSVQVFSPANKDMYRNTHIRLRTEYITRMRTCYETVISGYSWREVR